MNVALHGMEEAAGVRYDKLGTNAARVTAGAPALVRYADDALVLCHSREQAQQVKARLAAWLAPRGLVFNEDKTRIVHLDEGCDFLGFNIRRYRGKLLTKPSKAAIRRIRERLAAEMKALRGANADAVISKLNPITKGWAAYYRIGVSSQVFTALDAYMWRLEFKWARFSHPNKPRHWVTARYFGEFNRFRRDKWVFGDRGSGFYLRKFAWTKIARHRIVPGTASPDDPALADFWAQRRNRRKPPLGTARLRLLQAQNGRCPLCRGLLLHADHEPQSPGEWEQWLVATRKTIRKHAIAPHASPGTPGEPAVLQLIHGHCRRRLTSDPAPGPAQHPVPRAPGLA
jgi:RNA-directed DNA polymerase